MKGCESGLCSYYMPVSEYEYPLDLYRCDMYDEDWNISCVAEAFEKVPTGFEHLCAEILQNLGGHVRITPPVKDGGYDLDIWYQSHRYLAECKCYMPENKIGRPHLQKLVGANAVEHADGLIFITTSSYTDDAKEYARQVGMRLVDGDDFTYLMRAHWEM